MSPVIAANAPRRHVLDEETYVDLKGRTDDPLGLIVQRILEARLHFLAPVSRQQSSAEEIFQDLKQQWESETEFLSSTSEISMHAAYQRMIAQGWTVLPYILRDLEAGAPHWFWALKAITGADPVDAKHRGNRKLMASDWLRWARDEKLKW